MSLCGAGDGKEWTIRADRAGKAGGRRALAFAPFAARHYANSDATDKERLAAQHALKGLYRQLEAPDCYEAPGAHALNAASFVLEKRIVWAVEWNLHWADLANNPADSRRLDYERPNPALEALAQ